MFLFFPLTLSTTVITWPELQNRSPDSICAAYQDNYVFKPTQQCFTPNPAQCGVGTHSQEDIAGTTKRLNFFRQLTGMGLTTTSTNAANIRTVMEACMIMQASGYFGHSIPTSSTCYTSQGANGAANSNIFWTSGSACSTNSITAYIDDSSVDSLGHRRWLLNPPLSEACAGLSQKYSAIRVMGVGSANTFAPRFIAYPPPGPIPYDLIYRYWSFSRQYNRSSQALNSMPSDSTVSVKCDCSPKTVSTSFDHSNTAMYPGMVKFDVGSLKPGSFCQVTIKSQSLDTEWRYTVNAINCTNRKAYNVANPRCEGDPNDGTSGKKLSGGGIAGIVIAVMIIVAAAAVGCYFFYTKVYLPKQKVASEGNGEDAHKLSP